MIPPATDGPFYVAGGTMSPDRPSYVERRADKEILESLGAGQFCYVLTPRQMGKSSLLARTVRALEAEGWRTAFVDLSTVGSEAQEISAELWYYTVAHRVGRGLKIKGLKTWWKEREALTPSQRLTEFFEELVVGSGDGKILVAFDEIDSTLPYGFTDDFFAAIRGLHNARAAEPELARLTFVLLGVASPSELIKDPRRTPFNIGRRVELSDFTASEAAPLAEGLPIADPAQAAAALERVLYWTGGHPYLTQTVCYLLARTGLPEIDDEAIDRLVSDTFFSPQAVEQQDNLSFVSTRLLKNRTDLRPILLALYEKVLREGGIPDDPASEAHAELKLSGLVVVDGDRLRVRNRIYRQVFSADWVREKQPVNWYRRAAVGLAAVLAVVLVIGALALRVMPAWQTLLEATDVVPRAAYERLRSVPGFAARADSLWLGYWERRAARAEAQERRDEALLARLEALVVDDTPERRAEVRLLIGDEYPHLVRTFRLGEGVEELDLSPDGDRILCRTESGRGLLWPRDPDGATVQLEAGGSEVTDVAMSDDGRQVAAAFDEGVARVWDTESGELLTELANPIPPVNDLVQKDTPAGRPPMLSLDFGPDGDLVTTSGEGATVWWGPFEAAASEPRSTQFGSGPVVEVHFCSDGRRVLTTDGVDVQAWPVGPGNGWGPAPAPGLGDELSSLALVCTAVAEPELASRIRELRAGKRWDLTDVSSDGRHLLVNDGSTVTRLVDVASGEARVAGFDGGLFLDRRGSLFAHALAGELVVVRDGEAIRLVVRGVEPEGRADIRASGDGRYLVTGDSRGVVRLWSVPTRPAAESASADPSKVPLLPMSRLEAVVGDPDDWRGPLSPIDGSDDSRWFAAVTDEGAIEVWDFLAEEPSGPIHLRGTVPARGLLFGEANSWFVAGDGDRRLELWRFDGERWSPTVSVGLESSELRALALDGRGRIAAQTADGALEVWDGELGSRWSGLTEPQPDDGGSFSLQLAGSWLIAASGEELDLFDLDSAHEAAARRIPGGTLPEISPDGRWIVTYQQLTATLVDLLQLGREVEIRTGGPPVVLGPRQLAVDGGGATEVLDVGAWLEGESASPPLVTELTGTPRRFLDNKPTGRWLVTETEGTERIWDVERDFESVIDWSVDGSRIRHVASLDSREQRARDAGRSSTLQGHWILLLTDGWAHHLRSTSFTTRVVRSLPLQVFDPLVADFDSDAGPFTLVGIDQHGLTRTTLAFIRPKAAALEGDPAALLEDWARRLNLQLEPAAADGGAR